MLKALFVALFLILGELAGLTCFAAAYLPGYGPHLSWARPMTLSELVVWADFALATVVVPVGLARIGGRTFDSHFER